MEDTKDVGLRLRCQIHGCNAKEDLYQVGLDIGDGSYPLLCVCGHHEQKMFHGLTMKDDLGNDVRIPIRTLTKLVDAEGEPCSPSPRL